jgi:hypothetical protein
MADNKPKKIKINAPKAIAKWPKLTEPDYGTAMHPKPEGEYSVKLVWDESDPAFQKFQARMQPLMDAAVEQGQAAFNALKKPQRDKLEKMKVNPLFTPIYDENDEPTGQVEMKLAMTASGVVKSGPREGKKWARSPQLFDALGRPITAKVNIWGGSELIVAFTVNEGGYFIAGTGACGLKCHLEAVQIVTLRAGGTKSAGDYGFGTQEGGFDVSQLPPEDGEGSAEDDEFAGAGAEDNHLPTDDKEPDGSADF